MKLSRGDTQAADEESDEDMEKEKEQLRQRIETVKETILLNAVYPSDYRCERFNTRTHS